VALCIVSLSSCCEANGWEQVRGNSTNRSRSSSRNMSQLKETWKIEKTSDSRFGWRALCLCLLWDLVRGCRK